jgi:translation elongation factor EF-1alpha
MNVAMHNDIVLVDSSKKKPSLYDIYQYQIQVYRHKYHIKRTYTVLFPLHTVYLQPTYINDHNSKPNKNARKEEDNLGTEH